MCNWRKWIWPGVLAVALLTALAMMMKSGPIEQDLTAKAGSGLSGTHGWASVELDGRDLTLSGSAPSQEAITEALAIAENAYDVRVVSNAANLMALAEPFAMGAVKDAGKVTLTGSVPWGERANLVDAAKSANPDAEIVDNMEYARGAPDGFAAVSGFGLAQLGKLVKGRLSVENTALSLEGEAADSDTFKEVTAALAGQIPGGGSLGSENIMAPAVSPFTFSATETESGITLEGYVPDEATRAALVDAAGRATSGAVTDRLELASGASAGFGALSGFAVSQLEQLSNGIVSLSDSGLTVRGTALSAGAYDTVTGALAGTLPGGGQLALADITRNTVSPYTLSAVKQKGTIVLDGYVGSDSERADLVAYAQTINPTDRVIDRLVVANGAPAGANWADAARFAIQGASGLSEGEASLRDAAYSIDGMAATNDSFERIAAANAGSLPGGISLASASVRRPVIDPYVWSFSNMENEAPMVSGYVPEEAMIDDTAGKITAAVGTEKPLSSSLEIGAGAPRGLEGAISVAIQAASRLVNGKAEISGTELAVSGEALSQSAAVQVRAQVENALPPGFTGSHAISVREVASVQALSLDECQEMLNAPLRHNSIRFETARATIQPDSFALLDRLAFAAQRCPEAGIEIGGHTDSDGSEAYNQDLSEQRANAVRDYLQRAGVLANRMTAIGYGESRPIGDNATDAGKAANRRIEFTVTR